MDSPRTSDRYLEGKVSTTRRDLHRFLEDRCLCDPWTIHSRSFPPSFPELSREHAIVFRPAGVDREAPTSLNFYLTSQGGSRGGDGSEPLKRIGPGTRDGASRRRQVSPGKEDREGFLRGLLPGCVKDDGRDGRGGPPRTRERRNEDTKGRRRKKGMWTNGTERMDESPWNACWRPRKAPGKGAREEGGGLTQLDVTRRDLQARTWPPRKTWASNWCVRTRCEARDEENAVQRTRRGGNAGRNTKRRMCLRAKDEEKTKLKRSNPR